VSLTDKETKAMVKVARSQGWDVKITGGGHLKFVSPEGKMVFAPSTPSCRRGRLNSRAQLRRAGLKI
jgi:predicted RNA binding protein YcfA (HicA-like mRNA interferase family)